jgi:hypothetical protein
MSGTRSKDQILEKKVLRAPPLLRKLQGFFDLLVRNFGKRHNICISFYPTAYILVHDLLPVSVNYYSSKIFGDQEAMTSFFRGFFGGGWA